MTARVLVADALPTDLFNSIDGVQAEFRPALTADTLPDALSGVKILVVRSTLVTRAAIEAAGELALIVRAGSGVNNIDVEAASERGVYVANCPGRNAVAVAELAFGLILALDRRIPDNVADLRAGTWNKAEYAKASGLKGRRLGLVGFGSIAREVAVRAQAFGMEVAAFSRSLTEAEAKKAGVTRAESIDDVLADHDIVSLHVPATPETQGLVSAPQLARMKQGALLINTARHQAVDHGALIEALEAGRIRYGTDVYPAEPEAKKGKIEEPLAGLPGVYGTHHIGASTDQAQQEIAEATARIVRTFMDTGDVLDPVNLMRTPPTQGTLVVRHLDRVGVLAAVLGSLREARINVETMSNVVFEGGKAACARIEVSQRPSDPLMATLRDQDDVIGVELLYR